MPPSSGSRRMLSDHLDWSAEVTQAARRKATPPNFSAAFVAEVKALGEVPKTYPYRATVEG